MADINTLFEVIALIEAEQSVWTGAPHNALSNLKNRVAGLIKEERKPFLERQMPYSLSTVINARAVPVLSTGMRVIYDHPNDATDKRGTVLDVSPKDTDIDALDDDVLVQWDDEEAPQMVWVKSLIPAALNIEITK